MKGLVAIYKAEDCPVLPATRPCSATCCSAFAICAPRAILALLYSYLHIAVLTTAFSSTGITQGLVLQSPLYAANCHDPNLGTQRQVFERIGNFLLYRRIHPFSPCISRGISTRQLWTSSERSSLSESERCELAINVPAAPPIVVDIHVSCV